METMTGSIYQQWLEQSRAEGVNDERNLPFSLGSESKSALGLLLCHGFSASPWEMRLYGDKLTQEGYRVVAPRLPGHGTTAEDLEHRTIDEWLEVLAQGRQLLKDEGRQVVLIGLSMGALLQMALAAKHPPQGMLLMAPFLRTRHPLADLAGWAHPIYRWRQRPVGEMEQHAYYDRQPIKAIHQLSKLTRQVKKQLSTLHCPTLVMASDGDQTVDPRSGIDLFYRLGSRDKALHLFGPKVPHVLTSSENPNLSEVLKLSRMFLHRLEHR